MEKRKPHYDLVTVQAGVARLGVSAFTKSALDGGRNMGLTAAEMLTAVASLTRRHFYKSMTTYGNAQHWHDVYHCPVSLVGMVAYVKVTLHGERVVVSFKEKQE